jgi:branched-chain amino acid transport system permease protein
LKHARLNRASTDVLLIVLPVLALAIGMPFLYSNELLLFNFVAFLSLAQGLNLLYGFTGFLPFGYVGFFGCGAYGFALAVLHLHAPPLLALACAGVAAIVLAALLSPLLRLSGAYFAIASLAAAQAVYEIVANPALEPVTHGPYGVSLADVYAPGLSYGAAVAILAAALLAMVWLRNSRFGLSLIAAREDAISAAMVGVPVVRGRVIAWLLSAAVAGLVGGVYAWHISVFYPEAAFDVGTSIFAIVFTLFGGTGTITGPLLGVLLLYGLYNLIGITVPQYFQLIYGCLIVMLVLFLPNGVVSLLTRRGLRVP